jgi:hypothetical protein
MSIANTLGWLSIALIEAYSRILTATLVVYFPVVKCLHLDFVLLSVNKNIITKLFLWNKNVFTNQRDTKYMFIHVNKQAKRRSDATLPIILILQKAAPRVCCNTVERTWCTVLFLPATLGHIWTTCTLQYNAHNVLKIIVKIYLIWVKKLRL